MKASLVIISLFFLFSACHEIKPEHSQPKVLQANSGFDIAKMDFNENAFNLFSHILAIDGVRYDSVRDGKLDIEKLNFTSHSTMIEYLKFPPKKYGYLLESSQTDSVAQFEGIYFNEIKVVTKRDTSITALSATGDYITQRADLDTLMNRIFKKYGPPFAQYCLGLGFNVCTYEWHLNDRIIQLKTSRGFSAKFTTDTTKNGVFKYYKVDALVIKKSELKGLKDASTYAFKDIPNHTKYGIDEDIVSDDFIPTSLLPRYQNDSIGMYSIERAEND